MTPFRRKHFGSKAFRWVWAFRLLLAVAMIVAGSLHFLITPAYMSVMPAYLPWHRELVLLSGALEIAGGVALLAHRLRPYAGTGLILLYAAVLPANINMAWLGIQPADIHIPSELLWARVPLQFVLAYWAWVVSRPDRLPGGGARMSGHH